MILIVFSIILLTTIIIIIIILKVFIVICIMPRYATSQCQHLASVVSAIDPKGQGTQVFIGVGGTENPGIFKRGKGQISYHINSDPDLDQYLTIIPVFFIIIFMMMTGGPL